jgi:hypothetical protein
MDLTNAASSSSASSNFIRPDDFAGLLAALSKGVGVGEATTNSTLPNLAHGSSNNNTFSVPPSSQAQHPIYYGLPPSMSSNIWHQQASPAPPLIPPGFHNSNFVPQHPQQYYSTPLEQKLPQQHLMVKSKGSVTDNENLWWRKNYVWIVSVFLLIAGLCAAIAWMRMISMKEPTVKNTTEDASTKEETKKLLKVEEKKKEEEDGSQSEEEEDKDSVPKYDPDEEFNEIPPPSSVEEGVLKYLKNAQQKKEFMNWPNGVKFKGMADDQQQFGMAARSNNYIDISGEDLPDLEEELRENARKSAKLVKGKVVADESDEVKQYAKKRTLLFKSQNDRDESSEEE